MKRDINWEELRIVVKLLEPLVVALDVGQSDSRCLGMVRSTLFRLYKHFSLFDYPASSEQLLFNQHVLQSLRERKTYTLRPVHTLAYILYPRYIYRPDQPHAGEISSAFVLLKSLAAARDVKRALNAHGCDKEADLPSTYERAASTAIMAEYTIFWSTAVGNLVLEEAWEESTISSPRQW